MTGLGQTPAGGRHHVLPLAILLLVYAGLTLPFLADWPPAWPDESHFGEPSAMLAQTGQLRSDFIPAFTSQVSWQPPLYFFVLARVIGAVGLDLTALRAFSVLTGGLIVILTYWFGYRISRDRRFAFLAAILLVLNPNFTTYIKLVRMDGLCVLLQMGSLLTLHAWSQHRRWITLGASALLAGAAVVTHPLGIVAVAVGCVYLFFQKDVTGRERVAALAALVLPAVILLAVWIVAFVPDHAAMAEQLRFQFARKARPPWESAVNFVVRYRSIPVFLFFIVAVAVVWFRHPLFRRTTGHTLIALAAIAGTCAVALTFELPYHVYVLPWLSLCGAAAVVEILTIGSRTVRRIVAAILALVVLNMTVYSVTVYATLHWIPPVPGSAQALYEEVGSHLPSGAHVLLGGYPDGYWILHARRPDLHLVGGVAFTSAEKRALRKAVDYAVIARTFDPPEDSVALFRDLRNLLGVAQEDPWTIEAVEGEALRYHPSAWILRFREDPEKGGAHEQR